MFMAKKGWKKHTNNNIKQILHSEMWQQANHLHCCFRPSFRLTSGPSLQTLILHFSPRTHILEWMSHIHLQNKKTTTVLYRSKRPKAGITWTVISEPHRMMGHTWFKNILKSIQLSELRVFVSSLQELQLWSHTYHGPDSFGFIALKAW